MARHNMDDYEEDRLDWDEDRPDFDLDEEEELEWEKRQEV